MRCLYCGKELALLKRWTGSGEFCSDAHRQRYQEEYNQLALNRLLQAKPPGETQSPGANKSAPPAKAEVAEPVAEAAAFAEPVKFAQPVKQVPSYNAAPPSHIAPGIAASEPVLLKASEAAWAKPAYEEAPSAAMVQVEEPEPAADAPEIIDEPAPAEAAGFLVELPGPMLAQVAAMSRPEAEFLDAIAKALPDHAFEPLNGQQTFQLETAGLLAFQPSNRASNYTANGSRERRLEIRDFTRTAPIVEIDLSPIVETGLETSNEAMDILIFPQPPQGLPVLWQEPAVGFATSATELGDLARLSFTTTGFAGQNELGRTELGRGDSEHQSTEQETSNHEVLATSAVAVEEPAIETIPDEPAVELIAEVAPEPEVAEPVVEQKAEPVVATVAEPVVELPVPEQPVIEQKVFEQKAEKPEPVPATPVLVAPDPVTTPLPLSLQVVTPGKAKTVQVFSSASSSIEALVPRSTSLPLRPVMVFGPAPAKEVEKPAEKPAERAIEKQVERKMPERPAPVAVKTEPRKPIIAPSPVRPDPRIANGKLRRPEPEVKAEVKAEAKPEPKEDKKQVVLKTPEPEPVKEAASLLKQAAKTETTNGSKPPAKVEAKPDKKPEVKEPKAKEEVRVKPAEPAFPVPSTSLYQNSSDLGLPRLSLQSSPGFMSQIPMVAKIGIAVALVAGLGTVIALTSKSSGAAVTSNSAGTVVAGSALPVGEAGWITDWGADPGVRRTRDISILRSSQTLTDYRIEMQGQIETKAIGWVFRASDSKNFYVTKLEIVKPGLEPTVALVRFAVISGEEQAHAQLPLPMKVRRDTMYKIRFDAVGNHFTTYVQDVKIDDWTDDHVKTGGVGLYRERGEVATLKGGMSVVPLIVRK